MFVLGLLVVLFLFNAVLNSFCGMINLEIPRGRSVMGPESRYGRYGRALSCLRLVPVLSCMFLNKGYEHYGISVSTLCPTTRLSANALFTTTPLVLK